MGELKGADEIEFNEEADNDNTTADQGNDSDVELME
jgi:hypothetical protein